MKVIYKSDRVRQIAELIHTAHLITNKESYWENVYAWSDTDLTKALELVPSRFKIRGKESWNPELRYYIFHCRDLFRKYEIQAIRAGYILYKGKEVRNFTNDDCIKYKSGGA